MSTFTNIVLPLIVSVLLVWFTYLNINYFYTIHKLKKTEKGMELINTTLGIVVNYLVLILYVVGTLGSLGLIGYTAYNGTFAQSGLDYLNLVAIIALVANQYFSHIVYVSDKALIVGNIKFDYRKIKRIQFNPHKIIFNYGQNNLRTRLFFVDEDRLKTTLKRKS